MATKTKLRVQALAGKGLNSKKKCDSYCEFVVLDESGKKSEKAQTTKVSKATSEPQWAHTLEFNVDQSFSGILVRVWDKNTFRSDKFLGQVTIKLNKSLLAERPLDEWFKLNSRKDGEEVSGEVHVVMSFANSGSVNVTKERSATIANGETIAEVNVNQAFASKKMEETATHIVVDEKPAVVVVQTPAEVEEEPEVAEEDEEKTRIGASAVSLEKLLKTSKDLTFANKNLEVTSPQTNPLPLDYAIGTVKVNNGKWFYETRIQQTGQIQLGWATASFHPKNNTGESWVYDGSKQQKISQMITGDPYGEMFQTGDLIGCALDVSAKTIQYYRNGTDLGVAFQDVACGRGRLVPLVILGKRTKVQANFGKDTFAYPVEGFHPLHTNLTEKEVDGVTKLFNKYKEIGNAEEGAEQKDSVHGDGVIELMKDLGFPDDEDPSMFVLAYRFRCTHPWEISREEFVTSFIANNCANIEKMSAKLKSWNEDLSNPNKFKVIYNFVFDYLKEDKKILLIDEAIIAWNIILKQRNWPLLPNFLEFLQEEGKKAISRDAWQQLWHFMNAYAVDLKAYDTNSSWPILFDEFQEWMAKK